MIITQNHLFDYLKTYATNLFVIEIDLYFDLAETYHFALNYLVRKVELALDLAVDHVMIAYGAYQSCYSSMNLLPNLLFD